MEFNYDIYRISLAVVASLIILATFIICIVVPEMKNLYGALVRRFLVSLFGFYAIDVILPLVASFGSMTAVNIYSGVVIYFWMANTLWLNVMNIKIWRRFRSMKSSDNIQSRRKMSLIRYSIYAWLTPCYYCIIMTGFLIYCWPGRYGEIQDCGILGHDLFWAYVWLAIDVGILIVNACLFTLTTFAIRKSRKERVPMVDGVDERQIENEKWFNTYVLLFLAMIIPTVVNLITWTTSLYLESELRSIIFPTVRKIISIAILVIIVSRNDIRMSFRQKIVQTMRQCGLTH